MDHSYQFHIMPLILLTRRSGSKVDDCGRAWKRRRVIAIRKSEEHNPQKYRCHGQGFWHRALAPSIQVGRVTVEIGGADLTFDARFAPKGISTLAPCAIHDARNFLGTRVEWAPKQTKALLDLLLWRANDELYGEPQFGKEPVEDVRCYVTTPKTALLQPKPFYQILRGGEVECRVVSGG